MNEYKKHENSSKLTSEKDNRITSQQQQLLNGQTKINNNHPQFYRPLVGIDVSF